MSRFSLRFAQCDNCDKTMVEDGGTGALIETDEMLDDELAVLDWEVEGGKELCRACLDAGVTIADLPADDDGAGS